MKVSWTPGSQADLRAIHRYIAEDSPGNATQMIDRLTRRDQQISAFPESGRMVPEYQQADLREVIEGGYRIIYRILADRIDILTVRHGSKRMSDLGT